MQKHQSPNVHTWLACYIGTDLQIGTPSEAAAPTTPTSEPRPSVTSAGDAAEEHDSLIERDRFVRHLLSVLGGQSSASPDQLRPVVATMARLRRAAEASVQARGKGVSGDGCGSSACPAVAFWALSVAQQSNKADVSSDQLLEPHVLLCGLKTVERALTAASRIYRENGTTVETCKANAQMGSVAVHDALRRCFESWFIEVLVDPALASAAAVHAQTMCGHMPNAVYAQAASREIPDSLRCQLLYNSLAMLLSAMVMGARQRSKINADTGASSSSATGGAAGRGEEEEAALHLWECSPTGRSALNFWKEVGERLRQYDAEKRELALKRKRTYSPPTSASVAVLELCFQELLVDAESKRPDLRRALSDSLALTRVWCVLGDESCPMTFWEAALAVHELRQRGGDGLGFDAQDQSARVGSAHSAVGTAAASLLFSDFDPGFCSLVGPMPQLVAAAEELWKAAPWPRPEALYGKHHMRSRKRAAVAVTMAGEDGDGGADGEDGDACEGRVQALQNTGAPRPTTVIRNQAACETTTTQATFGTYFEHLCNPQVSKDAVANTAVGTKHTHHHHHHHHHHLTSSLLSLARAKVLCGDKALGLPHAASIAVRKVHVEGLKVATGLPLPCSDVHTFRLLVGGALLLHPKLQFDVAGSLRKTAEEMKASAKTATETAIAPPAAGHFFEQAAATLIDEAGGDVLLVHLASRMSYVPWQQCLVRSGVGVNRIDL